MKNNNDPIRQENKKALPRFLLIAAVSLAGGVVLGLVMVLLDIGDFGALLELAGAAFTRTGAAWLLCVLPVAELAVGLPLYFNAVKGLEAWDGEDEAESGVIERKLSVCIWLTGMATILAFFLLAAMFTGLADMAGTERDPGGAAVFTRLAVFLATLLVTMIFQQKLVDAVKRLNPEKRGSIYDTKFQEKWLDSCDEAERALIGQCALKAYHAMTRACLVLWTVFTLGGMFYGWGFLPPLAVCAVWGVGQTVYSYWAVKLGKPGTKL